MLNVGQTRNKVCINSVFVHGYFKIKAPCRTRHPDKQYLLLAGNELEVFFNIRSYTLKLKKNIDFYLFQQNLRRVIQKHLNDISQWKISKTTAKVTNFQGSVTICHCEFRYFQRYLLPFLLETLTVERIGLAEERDEPTYKHLSSEEYLRNPIKHYGYLTLDLGNEEKLKFQPNSSKKTVQISFVFTQFPPNIQKAIRTVQALANFFETKRPNKRKIKKYLQKKIIKNGK